MPRTPKGASGPNQLFPGIPDSVDRRLAQVVEDLYDRVNFLLNDIASMREQIKQRSDLALKTKVDQQGVAIAAASDALTQLSTFVGFGQSQPISGNQATVDGGVTGYQFTVVSGVTTMSVANAAQARGAIAAAQAGNPAGAPTTITLAKITTLGTDGSITINASGVLTAFVQPT